MFAELQQDLEVLKERSAEDSQFQQEHCHKKRLSTEGPQKPEDPNPANETYLSKNSPQRYSNYFQKVAGLTQE